MLASLHFFPIQTLLTFWRASLTILFPIFISKYTFSFCAGAPVTNPRPPGEQQLCRRQHQHRPRRLRVVRRARRILGPSAGALRQEQRRLPAWQLVAENGGSNGNNLTHNTFYSFID